jgi:hypothetical protein
MTTSTTLTIQNAAITSVARICYNFVSDFSESVLDYVEDTYYDTIEELQEYCVEYYGKAVAVLIDYNEVYDCLCEIYFEADMYNKCNQDPYRLDTGEYLDYTFDSDLNECY